MNHFTRADIAIILVIIAAIALWGFTVPRRACAVGYCPPTVCSTMRLKVQT